MFFQEYNYNEFVKSHVYDLWNSYYNPNFTFISHELEKHGTCWKVDKGDKNLMDSNIVDLYNKYDPNDEFSYLNTYMSVAL